jgi:ATP-dependent DNA helicase RecG
MIQTNTLQYIKLDERNHVEMQQIKQLTGGDLVVLSFPGPDRSIRMEDLGAGKAVSRRYRNRRIGDFLKELDLTEGRSTGISKILKAIKENGSPAPGFDTDNDRSYFLIRLPVHEDAVVVETQVEMLVKTGHLKYIGPQK